jgi:hypothetical protein
VFDKAYVVYLQYYNWTLEDIYFVTRQKDNAVYQSLEDFLVGDYIRSGILKGKRIEILIDNQTITLRRLAFYHVEQHPV